jgi:hypothetical protein
MCSETPGRSSRYRGCRPRNCVVNWAPRGAQILGAMQSPTGSEAEFVTASPCGLLTPVLTLDRGAFAPLAGGAPNCNILPVPGVDCATKAYGKVEYVPTLILSRPAPSPSAKSVTNAPVLESKRITRPLAVGSRRLTPWPLAGYVVSARQRSIPLGFSPANELISIEVGPVSGTLGWLSTPAIAACE